MARKIYGAQEPIHKELPLLLETAVKGKVTGGSTLPFPSVGNKGGTGRGSVWELGEGLRGGQCRCWGRGVHIKGERREEGRAQGRAVLAGGGVEAGEAGKPLVRGARQEEGQGGAGGRVRGQEGPGLGLVTEGSR